MYAEHLFSLHKATVESQRPEMVGTPPASRVVLHERHVVYHSKPCQRRAGRLCYRRVYVDLLRKLYDTSRESEEIIDSFEKCMIRPCASVASPIWNVPKRVLYQS